MSSDVDSNDYYEDDEIADNEDTEDTEDLITTEDVDLDTLQEENISVNYIEDVSNQHTFSGSIIADNQKDTYKYIASVDGTYHFDTNLSSGGSVIVRISGENEDDIDYNYDALSVDLEEGKTYILSIEYRNGACDYTINTGIPIPIIDISGNSSISGNITYQDQKDKYYYTAPISGIYKFNTNLSSGGSVIVRISGENSKSIDYGYDVLSVDLETGKKYILSIEYRNGFCSYDIVIQTP